jgi:hypothetical protein
MTNLQFHLNRRAVVLGGGATSLTFATGLGPVASAPRPLDSLAPQGQGRVDQSAFNRLLKNFVRPDGKGYNRVDYRSLKRAGQADLKQYLEVIVTQNPVDLSRSEAQAYWINLYNAITLDVVLDAYPVSSIKKIALGGGGFFSGGPWSKKLITVAGHELSLDDIENRVVRPLFTDPMSHYGLNCASYSCPNLAAIAYTGDNVKAQLAQNARTYVNHPRGLTVKDGEITASKIYSWYADDFGGTARLKSHWKIFAAADLGARIEPAEINGYAYDWSINDL